MYVCFFFPKCINNTPIIHPPITLQPQENFPHIFSHTYTPTTTHMTLANISVTNTFYQLQLLDKILHTSYLIQTKIKSIHTNASYPVFTESGGPYGNQRYSRELLMMGIVLPEIC
jgi:hypothetical protein